MNERWVAKRPMRPAKMCDYHRKMHPTTWFDEGTTTCRRGSNARAREIAKAEAQQALRAEFDEVDVLVRSGHYRIAGRSEGQFGTTAGAPVLEAAVGDLMEVGFRYPGFNHRADTLDREVEVESVAGQIVTGKLLPDIYSPSLGSLSRREIGIHAGAEVSFPLECARAREPAGSWRRCPKCGAGLSIRWAVCSCGHVYERQCTGRDEFMGDWPGQTKSARCCLVEGHSGDHNSWSG